MLKPYFNKNLIEAGLDEVGRGCLAGPVVAAAVILPQNFSHPLLNDSKKLTSIERKLLDKVIKNHAIEYSIMEVGAKIIDEINILKASIHAMHLCVDQFKQKPQHLLVDGNRFYPYPLIPHTCVVKGDSKYNSIAAASILAKVYRDDLMKKMAQIHPGYGWEKNMGYPTKKHKQGILELGLSKEHRLSFKMKL